MWKKLTPYRLLVPQIILSIIFIVGLITGITESFGVIPAFGLTEPTLDYYKDIFSNAKIIDSIVYSLRVAFISASLSTLIGVWLCAIMVMSNKNTDTSMRIVQIPIIVPHIVAALFIISIISQSGITARILYTLGLITEQQDFPRLIYDHFGIGVITAYLWKEIPFIIYFVISLMANINGRLGEAAINLGAGKWTAFRKITLPLCKNTIISGFLIIFTFSLGAYELPAILGATIPRALSVEAYIQYTSPDLLNRPYAMALNGIIIFISALSAGIYILLMNRNVKKLRGIK